MFRHDVNECDLGHHQKSGISENSESKQHRELLQAASGPVMAAFRGTSPHFAGLCSVALQLAFYI